jgi:hypothetical protein
MPSNESNPDSNDPVPKQAYGITKPDSDPAPVTADGKICVAGSVPKVGDKRPTEVHVKVYSGGCYIGNIPGQPPGGHSSDVLAAGDDDYSFPNLSGAKADTRNLIVVWYFWPADPPHPAFHTIETICVKGKLAASTGC